jgi:xylulokinase
MPEACVPPDDVFLGLDLGTSGLKGVALTGSGAVIARASARYPTVRPETGAAEQDPADWTAAAGKVLDELASGADPSRWRGIGLAGMIPTLVTADRGGTPTGPAVTWQDSRADRYGDALRERCGGQALYLATGQWVDGRYLLPMYLRIAAADASRAAATASLLSAKDYLYWSLTGLAATDPSTASGFGCYDLHTGGWNQDIIAAAAGIAGLAGIAGQDLPELPSVLPSGSSRPLLAGIAGQFGCGQIPVCLGAADSVLGAFGLGVREPGQIGYVAGTSNVILGVSGRLVLDPEHRFLVTPMTEPDQWGLEMDLLATGDCFSWLAGLTGRPGREEDLVATAALINPRDAPVALPYLSPGEQGALWDERLHGTFAGLTLGHGAPHLARGLLNGIILESRRCLRVLEETGGFGRELRLGGASASHPAFATDLADATGYLVTMPSGPDASSSAVGAARLAALSVNGAEPARTGGDPIRTRRTRPDTDRAALWDELWLSYERARTAITSYYHG